MFGNALTWGVISANLKQFDGLTWLTPTMSAVMSAHVSRQ